jgi:hypothetical protein
MKISAAIARLQAIKKKFGDISITGGMMSDDVAPRSIIVTDTDGMEIWPRESGKMLAPVDGVFIE